MTPTIYQIEFPSGATYIGATVNFRERRRTHMRHGRRGHTRPSYTPYVQKGPEIPARCCHRYNTAYHIFMDRRRRGWNTLQALGLTPPPPQRKSKVKKVTMTIRGSTRTLDAWAKAIGITKGALISRKNSSWTDDQILGLAPSKQRNRELAAEQRAQEKVSKRAAKSITYKGVTGGISAVCRHFGVPDSQVRSRLKLGWTLQEAFEGRAKQRNAVEDLAAGLFDLGDTAPP